MALTPARRVGLYGGAFDPPHLTHVAMAHAAIDQLRLDALHVVPTGRAWHKPRELSAPEHRLAMARLAFDAVPHAVVDDREIRRAGPSYTVDTLRELAAENAGAELFLLIGADQAAALTTWHEWGEVLRLATISVAERVPAPGAPPAPALAAPDGARIVRLALAATDASATDIRQRVADGRDITALVPAAVARYIERHHLYPFA